MGRKYADDPNDDFPEDVDPTDYEDDDFQDDEPFDDLDLDEEYEDFLDDLDDENLGEIIGEIPDLED